MAKKKKRNRTKRRTIGGALMRGLRRLNPSKFKGVKHVRVKKLKSGGITFTPVRMPSERAVRISFAAWAKRQALKEMKQRSKR